MLQSNINNKRIAKNTVFLYIRMIVVLAIGLYTVRAVLDILGATDYGIYNVIGGVVGMFSFLNGTLTTASQRYFSIELAKNNTTRLNEWFCLNISIFSFLIILFLVIAETVGLWFINTQLTIPEERMFAANIIYQFSIFSFCVSFFSIPYDALIIAHEKMNAFAFISIVDAVLKLVIVFILIRVQYDKLIIYGLLMLIVSVGVTGAYYIYSRRHFEESKFHFYWNKDEFKELLGFSGWHLLGTFAMITRSQGINILINMFFNPAVNAARAVAYQVYSAVIRLSDSFFTAVTPQLYKSYSSQEYEGFYKLINRSTALCTMLVAILIFPLLSNTDYILNLWIKEVPEYTIAFTQLVLLNSLIDAFNGPSITAALASGKIKKFQLVVANVILLNLPISYVALKLGAQPTMTMVVSICISLASVFIRGYLLRSLVNLPLKKYFGVVVKILIASMINLAIVYLLLYNKADSLLSFIAWSIVNVVIVCALYLIIVFEKSDIKFLLNTVTNFIHRNR